MVKGILYWAGIAAVFAAAGGFAWAFEEIREQQNWHPFTWGFGAIGCLVVIMFGICTVVYTLGVDADYD